MKARAALPIAVVVSALVFGSFAACGRDTEVFEVRGQVAGVATGGKALVVDHEQIPGVMGAMRMEFPLRDPAAASGLAPGDKIAFELHRSGGRLSIGMVERLPAGSALELAAPPAGH